MSINMKPGGVTAATDFRTCHAVVRGCLKVFGIGALCASLAVGRRKAGVRRQGLFLRLRKHPGVRRIIQADGRWHRECRQSRRDSDESLQ